MTSIIPSLGTAVAGASQPNPQHTARDNPAGVQTAASIAVSAKAADEKSNGPEKNAKSRAPAAQKRVESNFASRSLTPRPSEGTGENEQEQKPPSAHDGKLDVVA